MIAKPLTDLGADALADALLNFAVYLAEADDLMIATPNENVPRLEARGRKRSFWSKYGGNK